MQQYSYSIFMIFIQSESHERRIFLATEVTVKNNIDKIKTNWQYNWDYTIMCYICVYYIILYYYPVCNNWFCLFYSLSVVLSFTDSEDKSPQATLDHQAESSRANQSQTIEVTDNDEEPIGDRWDEEEDWGSLEVGFYPL